MSRKPPLPAQTTRDAWRDLSQFTDARIAIGRSGSALPTREVLGFGLAHAKARDAVHMPFDAGPLAACLQTKHRIEPLHVASAAQDRSTYLRRPDLGRKLDQDSRDRLARHAPENCDIAIVVADGLSATAVAAHSTTFLEVFMEQIRKTSRVLAPVTIVENGRVAIGDEIGHLLNARIVLVLIGERPGLSAADSLGAYVTFAPRPGRNDSERNCISNIRDKGLKPHLAAQKAAWLIEQALTRGVSGVALKDNSDTAPRIDRY